MPKPTPIVTLISTTKILTWLERVWQQTKKTCKKLRHNEFLVPVKNQLCVIWVPIVNKICQRYNYMNFNVDNLLLNKNKNKNTKTWKRSRWQLEYFLSIWLIPYTVKEYICNIINFQNMWYVWLIITRIIIYEYLYCILIFNVYL